MDLELHGKRALVTGGSKGISLAIARQLAAEGADVALAARNAAEVEAAAEALANETSRKVVGLMADTNDDPSVKALIAETGRELGGLDILVDAAAQAGGQSPPPPLAGVTDALFWDDVSVKVLGYRRTAREAAPHMIAGGWGRIINITGLAARLRPRRAEVPNPAVGARPSRVSPPRVDHESL